MLLPGAGAGDVGSTVDRPTDIEGLSVSRAIVGRNHTVRSGPSVRDTVDGAMVITIDVGVGARGIVGGDSVDTGIGQRGARHSNGVMNI